MGVAKIAGLLVAVIVLGFALISTYGPLIGIGITVAIMFIGFEIINRQEARASEADDVEPIND